jgi:hypothetical protein
MRIAVKALVSIIALTQGCVQFKHSTPPANANLPPERQRGPTIIEARHQASLEDPNRRSDYDNLVSQLQTALGPASPRIVVMWNVDMPEGDGGWQGRERISLKSQGKLDDRRASIAAHLSHEVFSRPRLESHTPDHRDAIEANITGMLLKLGANMTDLKVAALRAQPTVGQDEVYHQVKAMLDNATLCLEIATLNGATAVRVRDLSTASLLAYASLNHQQIYSQTSPRKIFNGERVSFDQDPESVATFAAVGATLLDGLKRRQ